MIMIDADIFVLKSNSVWRQVVRVMLDIARNDQMILTLTQEQDCSKTGEIALIFHYLSILIKPIAYPCLLTRKVRRIRFVSTVTKLL